MPTKEITITVRFPYDSDGPADQFTPLHRVIDAVQEPGTTVSVELDDKADKRPAAEPSPEPTTRRRRRTNGAEPTLAPPVPATSAMAGATAPDVPDVAGDDKPDDEAEDLGLSDPGRTEQESLEAGMGGVRNLWNAGHKDPVRSLRKKYGVTKFDEIMPKDGHAFYKDVAALLEKVGMHI